MRLTASTAGTKNAAVPTTCSAEGCTRPARAHGLCNTHYMRGKRNSGDPLAPIRPKGRVRLPACRVEGEVAAALEKEATAEGRELHEHLAHLLTLHIRR